MPRVLVVEDDPEMARLLTRGLREEGYEVIEAHDGTAGLMAAVDGGFAAAVDVMLPGLDGFEFCRQLRMRGVRLPVLLLTARDAIEDRVQGLDSGADDYLVKPFAFAELSARIRALVRRETQEPKVVVTVGRLELDGASLRARVAGEPVALSAREFALARLFAVHAGEDLTRATILGEVWGTTRHIDPNVVDQYVRYLWRRSRRSGRSAVRCSPRCGRRSPMPTRGSRSSAPTRSSRASPAALSRWRTRAPRSGRPTSRRPCGAPAPTAPSPRTAPTGCSTSRAS
ncbi:MAG: DNA-binding response regulator [Microbacteriaceae bacterium]|nr:MAG: DNA-binding response regulator [Microbacteriaceae bacterium]